VRQLIWIAFAVTGFVFGSHFRYAYFHEGVLLVRQDSFTGLRCIVRPHAWLGFFPRYGTVPAGQPYSWPATAAGRPIYCRR
jgi:hypothetical protein